MAGDQCSYSFELELFHTESTKINDKHAQCMQIRNMIEYQYGCRTPPVSMTVNTWTHYTNVRFRSIQHQTCQN